jgi:hypothetical protein
MFNYEQGPHIEFVLATAGNANTTRPHAEQQVICCRGYGPVHFMPFALPDPPEITLAPSDAPILSTFRAPPTPPPLTAPRPPTPPPRAEACVGLPEGWRMEVFTRSRADKGGGTYKAGFFWLLGVTGRDRYVTMGPGVFRYATAVRPLRQVDRHVTFVRKPSRHRCSTRRTARRCVPWPRCHDRYLTAT